MHKRLHLSLNVCLNEAQVHRWCIGRLLHRRRRAERLVVRRLDVVVRRRRGARAERGAGHEPRARRLAHVAALVGLERRARHVAVVALGLLAEGREEVRAPQGLGVGEAVEPRVHVARGPRGAAAALVLGRVEHGAVERRRQAGRRRQHGPALLQPRGRVARLEAARELERLRARVRRRELRARVREELGPARVRLRDDGAGRGAAAAQRAVAVALLEGRHGLGHVRDADELRDEAQLRQRHDERVDGAGLVAQRLRDGRVPQILERAQGRPPVEVEEDLGARQALEVLEPGRPRRGAQQRRDARRVAPRARRAADAGEERGLVGLRERRPGALVVDAALVGEHVEAAHERARRDDDLGRVDARVFGAHDGHLARAALRKHAAPAAGPAEPREGDHDV